MVKNIKVTLDESLYDEIKIHYPLAMNDSERVRMAMNDALEEKRLSLIKSMDFDERTTELEDVLHQLGNLTKATDG